MRRDSSTVQANSWGAASPASASSACQNLLSNDALWATMGAAPTKRAASRITSAAGGAVRSMALVMPVSSVMKGETQAPVCIRLWKRSTTRPCSSSTMATSVALAPWAGVMPVVSKSMTAIAALMTALCRGRRLSPGPARLLRADPGAAPHARVCETAARSRRCPVAPRSRCRWFRNAARSAPPFPGRRA